MLQRLSALLLALVWALMLSACGGTDGFVFTEGTASIPGASALEESAPVEEPGSPAETEQAESEPSETQASETQSSEGRGAAVTEDGWYSSKEDVALYIHLYGHLPDNYVTKREAQDKGWSGGSVERYTGAGTAIGGSRFGNYEGLLPEKEGRSYTECDIDTVGTSSRGAKRIVFSNDGLIYYTGDHYASFELLYGEE